MAKITDNQLHEIYIKRAVYLQKISAQYANEISEIIEKSQWGLKSRLIREITLLTEGKSSIRKIGKLLKDFQTPGFVAATNSGAIIVDPRPYITGTMKTVFEEFPQITQIVPAMGYNDQQIKDMEDTLNKADCEYIIDGSPIDLEKLINSRTPIIRVSYDIEAVKSPTIEETLDKFIEKFL